MGTQKPKNKTNFSPLEKIVFFISLTIMIFMITYLIFNIIHKNNTPAEIIVSTKYQPKMSNYTFKVIVENKGENTAEDVHIKLDLYQQGELTETGEIAIDYVPVKSKKTLWAVFYKKRKPMDSLVVSSLVFLEP